MILSEQSDLWLQAKREANIKRTAKCSRTAGITLTRTGPGKVFRWAGSWLDEVPENAGQQPKVLVSAANRVWSHIMI